MHAIYKNVNCFKKGVNVNVMLKLPYFSLQNIKAKSYRTKYR